MARPLYLLVSTPRAGDTNHRLLVSNDSGLTEIQAAEKVGAAIRAAGEKTRSEGSDYVVVCKYGVRQMRGEREQVEALLLGNCPVRRLRDDHKWKIYEQLNQTLAELEPLFQQTDVWDAEAGMLVVRKELTDRLKDYRDMVGVNGIAPWRRRWLPLGVLVLVAASLAVDFILWGWAGRFGGDSGFGAVAPKPGQTTLSHASTVEKGLAEWCDVIGCDPSAAAADYGRVLDRGQQEKDLPDRLLGSLNEKHSSPWKFSNGEIPAGFKGVTRFSLEPETPAPKIREAMQRVVRSRMLIIQLHSVCAEYFNDIEKFGAPPTSSRQYFAYQLVSHCKNSEIPSSDPLVPFYSGSERKLLKDVQELDHQRGWATLGQLHELPAAELDLNTVPDREKFGRWTICVVRLAAFAKKNNNSPDWPMFKIDEAAGPE